MYVAELDRPWTETHFPFQGFRVERDEDLRYLRDTCSFLLIDVDKGDVPLRYRAQVIPVGGAKARRSNGLHRVSASAAVSTSRRQGAPGASVSAPKRSSLPPREQEYPETATVEQEFTHADVALGAVHTAYTDFIANVASTRAATIEPLRETIVDIESSIIRNPDAMMLLCHLRSHDSYTYRHAISSSVLAIVFGRHLGLKRQQIHDLGVGMLLADIGKLHLPKVILDAPRKLSESEFGIVKKHVEYGLHVLDGSPGVTPGMRTVVEHHHERFNGYGYPRGLAGDDIPMLGRIGGIVDAYDAMTSERVYAKGQSALTAIQDLYALRDIDFQGELVEQFIQTLGIYPVGTLVLLSNEEIGVVIGVNRLRRLQPKVMVLLDGTRQPLTDNRIVDLAAQPDDAGLPTLAIREVLPPGAYGITPDDYYL